MLHTTFRLAKSAGACTQSYRKMAKALGGVTKYGENTPIPLDKILDTLGLSDTLWALRITIEPVEQAIKLLACDYAEHVLPLYEAKYPSDSRPRHSIETARRYAQEKATRLERDR